ncbi:MAG TPA: hypothetical protein VGD81_20115 [Opitutaceae bacterium]
MLLIFANAGLPMLFYHLPAMVLALVPVVLAEWFVAHRGFGIAGKRALKGVVAANCFSALLGFPLFWFVGVVGLVVVGPFLSDVLPGFPTALQAVFDAGAGAFWLGPEPSGFQVMQAGAAMLVPAFVVSVCSERWVLRWMWRDLPPATLSRFTWQAHLVSYPVLAVVWLWYLAANW